MVTWNKAGKAEFAKRNRKAVSTHPELASRIHLTGAPSSQGAVHSNLQDFTDYSEVYATHTWVRRGITVLADNLAKLPVEVVDKNNKVIKDHPLSSALNTCNDKYGPVEMWRMWVSHMILGGESFIEVVPTADKEEPAEFWVRRPDQVGVIPDKTRPNYPLAAGYVWNDVDYEPEEMIHWRFENPLSPWRGLSLIGAVRQGIIIDVYAQAWSRTFLQGGGRPDWALVAPEGTTQEEREELEEKMGRKFLGFDNAHRPIVLEEGVYDIKVLSFPPVDMQWLEQRKLARDEIGAILGVPDILMGFGADSYDTMEKRDAATAVLWTITLIPLVEHRDDQLNQFFTKTWPLLEEGQTIRTNMTSVEVLQEDAQDRIPMIDALWAKGMPMAKINEYLGLDLPKYDGWDIGYLPFGLMATQTEESEVQTQPLEPDEVDEELDESPDSDEGTSIDEVGWQDAVTKVSISVVKSADLVPAFGSYQHRIIMAQFDQKVLKFEEEIERIMARTFQQQQNDLLRSLREQSKAQKQDETLFSEGLWDMDAENARIAAALNPAVRAAYELYGPAALEMLGAHGLDPFSMDPFVIEAIEYIVSSTAAKVNYTTWSQVTPILQEGMRQGASIVQMGDMLNEYWDVRKSKGQRERIARTVVTGAANSADHEAWRQSGIVQGSYWLAALDTRVRDEHAIAHGQWQSLGNKFEVGGEMLEYPGDPAGSPGNIIHCRCTTIPDARMVDNESLMFDFNTPHAQLGSASGGVTRQDLEDMPAGTYLIRGRKKQDLIETLENRGVPRDHLDGIKFATKPPEGYRDTGGGYKLMSDAASGGAGARGMYADWNGTVHIHEVNITTFKGLQPTTLTHEIGHHVVETRFKTTIAANGAKARGVIDKINVFSDAKPELLADLGLRNYSLNAPHELMADAYNVWLRGSDAQWGKLTEMFHGSDIDLLDIFGDRSLVTRGG